MERRDRLAITESTGPDGIFDLVRGEHHHFDILSRLEPTGNGSQFRRFEDVHQFIREPR